MFDIGWDEMLFTAAIAIVVIGPKDLPRAMRTAGQWIGKVRRVSNHFRSGIETMIREAEIEEMEKQWREQNAGIMAAYPPQGTASEPLVGVDPGTLMEPLPPAVTEPPAKPKPKRKAAVTKPVKPAAKKPATKKPAAKPRAKAAK